MGQPTSRSMAVRIGFAVVGILIGLCVGVVFGAKYHNVNAAIWGLISGLAAAFTLYVHVTYKKKYYDDDPSPLRVYMYCGCFTQLAGICGFIVYIVLAVYENQGVVVYGPGYFIASVWCFMTLKWGFLLFFFSRIYWRSLTGDCQLLPSPEKAVQAVSYGAKC